MAITVLLKLDNSDFLQKGEQTKQVIQDIAAATKAAGEDVKFNINVGGATDELNQHAHAVSGVTEAYHILAPLLREAGIAFTGLRELATLARFTIVGFAAVVGTELVLALANAEEAAARAKASFQGLFGANLGAQAFGGAKQAADDLNTTVAELAPAIKAAGQAFQTAGLGNDIKGAVAATENLILILRSAGLATADATKEATAFFAALAASGKLTPEVLKTLDPATYTAVGKALGFNTLNAKQFNDAIAASPIAVAGVITQFEHLSDAQKKVLDQQAVEGYKEEFQGLLNDLSKGFDDLTGGPVNAFAAGLKAAIASARSAVPGFFDAIKEGFRNTAELDLAAGAVGASAGAALEDEFAKITDKLRADFIAAGGDAGRGFSSAAANAAQTVIKDKPTFRFVDAPAASAAGAEAGDTFSSAFANAAQAKAKDKPEFRFVDAPTAAAAGADAADTFSSAFANAMQNKKEGLPQFKFTIPPPDATDATAAAKQAGKDIQAAILAGVTPVEYPQPDFTAAESGAEQAAHTLWNNIKDILSQPIQIPVPGLEGPFPTGQARGGLIVGPGTGTSDSILARLSNMEFVMSAAATTHYGPGFMAALNAMAVPRDVLPGFSMGGLVRAISGAASFAQGGQARTPIHLHIGRQVFGMFADDAVAAALARSSVSEQLSQTGRSPGWRRT